MGRPLDEMTPEELGILFPISLADPDPGWPDLFQAEKERITGALGPEQVTRIEHIGSTAIPGIRAKPSIDVLLEIPATTRDEVCIDGLKRLGYHYIPRPDNPPPHMMFVRGYTLEGFRGQAYHIHVRYGGDWDEIRFRDYLRIHPGVAREYEALKISLSEEFRNDRDGYTRAKSGFIKDVLKKAHSKS
jgi:GrpB-like predicted nucleotidyltransferase (UPF0157 family)